MGLAMCIVYVTCLQTPLTIDAKVMENMESISGLLDNVNSQAPRLRLRFSGNSWWDMRMLRNSSLTWTGSIGMTDNRISGEKERTASVCGLLRITDGTTFRATPSIASSAKIAMRVDVASTTSETTTRKQFTKTMRLSAVVIGRNNKLTSIWIRLGFIMRPSSLGGDRIMRRTLSVCLSVCLSVRLSVRPSRYRCHRSRLFGPASVTSRHLANYNDTHVLFGTHWGPHIVRPSRPHKFSLVMHRR